MNDRISQFNARRQIDAQKTRNKKRRSKGVLLQFRLKAKHEGRCRNPNCRTPNDRVEAHHIVHRSKLIGKAIEVRDDVRNSMPLCHGCHMAYHNGKLVFDRGMLEASEIAYIIEHAGQAWLDKVYPERLDDGGLRRLRGGRGWSASQEAARLAAEARDDYQRASRARAQDGA